MTVHERLFESARGHHEHGETRSLGLSAKASVGSLAGTLSRPEGDPARTEDDKALTFATKADARTWLALINSQISLGLWEPPAVVTARCRVETAAEIRSSLRVSCRAERP